MPLFRLSGQADGQARDSPVFPAENTFTETIAGILRFTIGLSNDLQAKTLNGTPVESCDYTDILEPPAINVLEVEAVKVIQQVQPPPGPFQEQLTQIKGTYTNRNEIIKYISTSVNMEDVRKFLKLVQYVHDNMLEGLLEFICVLAPSYTGKTQLAFSVDKLCASRLYASADESPVEPLLQACIRFACQGLVTENYLAGQEINQQIFTDAMKKSLEHDLNSLKEFKDSTSDLKIIISDISIFSCFARKKSKTLGLLVAWFRARVDGSDAKALQDRAYLSLDVIPLNIYDARVELKKLRDLDELGKGKNLPFLFILDEFSFSGNHSKDCFLVMLRELIKVLQIVAVTMGTNPKVTNMTAPLDCGGDSGLEPHPWALVVTDIFRPLRISNINEAEETLKRIKQLNEFDDEEMKMLRAWLDSCPTLRPGFYNLFWRNLKKLETRRMHSPLDLILVGLQILNSQIRQRKGNSTDTIEWVVGQVESLLAETRALKNSKSPRLKILLNDHYAFSVSHSFNNDIPFYSIFRQPVEDKKGQFVSIPWIRDSSGVEPSLREDVQVDIASIPGYPPGIKCPVSVNKGTQIFSTRCGYPAYEHDEMGYLSMFAGNYPLDPEISLLFMGPLFRLETDSSMTSSQREIYQDLRARKGSSRSLTTRAAVTIDYRFLFSKKSTEGSSECKIPKGGDFFPALGLAAFTVASQKAGFSGVAISKFIPLFIEELALRRRRHTLSLSTKGLESLGFFKDFFIPFIPLIHAKCSSELQAMRGFNSGSLLLTPAPEQIDAAGSEDRLTIRAFKKTKKTRDATSDHVQPGKTARQATSGSSESLKDTKNKKATKLIALGSADRLMTKDPGNEDFCRDVQFSAEFKCVTDAFGKEGLISVGSRISQEISSFERTPAVHYHFLVVSKLANVTCESWLCFQESLPGLEVRIAKLEREKDRFGRTNSVINLINPLNDTDMENAKIIRQQTTDKVNEEASNILDAGKDNVVLPKTEAAGKETAETAEKLPPAICLKTFTRPTMMIIFPVEDLFPEDGIITFYRHKPKPGKR